MTKKRKNTKFRDSLKIIVTILFLLSCAGGAYYCIRKFYESINASLTKLNEKPIATITFKHKTAQRKFEERTVWDRLKQNSPVYDGDTIRIAPESEATIYFEDGNIMDLGENTMAQVFFHNGKMLTNIDGGSVVVNSTDAANGAVVMMGNSKVELEAGSSVGTSFSQDSGAQINVIEGGAVFSNEAGETQTIEEGKSLALDKDNSVKVVPIITVKSPRPNEKILNFTGESQSVDFKWDVQNLAEDDFLVIEISSDKKFKNVIERKELKNLNEINIDLENSISYWRIFPKNAGEEFSAQNKITVFNAPPPALVVPKDEANFSYKTNTPDVRFSWTQNNFETAFEFEVADNPQMENPAIRQRVTTASSIVSSLGEGIWYWRVTPYYTINNTGLAGSSEVRSFEIARRETLGAAELTMPAFGETINTVQKDLLQFSWKKNAEVAECEIVISQDSECRSAKIKETVKSNFFSLRASENAMQKGTWYWQVRQIDKHGDATEPSQIWQFNTDEILFEQRLVYPPENFAVNDTSVGELRFSWKTNIEGDNILQIAGDRNFENIVLEQTANEQYFQGAKLAGGTYYWRIGAKDSFEEHSTAARELTVVASIPVETPPEEVPFVPLELGTPALVSPVGGAALTVTAQTARNAFKWNAVENAEYYLLTVYRANNPNAVLYSDTLKATNTSINLTNFAEGNYGWSVQPVATNEDSTRNLGGVGRGTFEVRKIIKLTLEYPENGAKVDGLLAAALPGTVRWDSTQRTQNAVFTVSRRRNGYSNPIYTLRNPGKEVRLPPLEPGTYYWTVRAQNVHGADISPQEARQLVVSTFTPLQAVKINSPSDKTHFGEKEIKNSRTINFSWSAVKDATAYRFTLKNSRGEVLANLESSGTTYRVPNMLNLGSDTYTWSVQPIQAMRDGTVLQRGQVSSATFTISIPEVEDIVIDDLGIFYGM